MYILPSICAAPVKFFYPSHNRDAYIYYSSSLGQNSQVKSPIRLPPAYEVRREIMFLQVSVNSERGTPLSGPMTLLGATPVSGPMSPLGVPSFWSHVPSGEGVP